MRSRPPKAPAGLTRCDRERVKRWKATSFRFPPYHYTSIFCLYDKRKEQWEPPCAEVRQVAMFFRKGHAFGCLKSSEITESADKHEDVRRSTLRVVY